MNISLTDQQVAELIQSLFQSGKLQFSGSRVKNEWIVKDGVLTVKSTAPIGLQLNGTDLVQAEVVREFSDPDFGQKLETYLRNQTNNE